MDRIEEIREKIGECDDIIIEQLAVRMSQVNKSRKFSVFYREHMTDFPILHSVHRFFSQYSLESCNSPCVKNAFSAVIPLYCQLRM